MERLNNLETMSRASGTVGRRQGGTPTAFHLCSRPWLITMRFADRLEAIRAGHIGRESGVRR